MPPTCTPTVGPITETELEWARAARKAHPELTLYGLGVPEGCEDTWGAELDLQTLEAVAVSRRWLEAQTRLPFTTEDSPRCYYLKHRVEQWLHHPKRPASTYVSPGALVLAAAGLGIPITKVRDYWLTKVAIQVTNHTAASTRAA